MRLGRGDDLVEDRLVEQFARQTTVRLQLSPDRAPSRTIEIEDPVRGSSGAVS